ncbi:hypothetical protein E3O48_05555, partial [Cryobacterium sp. HLT2-28]
MVGRDGVHLGAQNRGLTPQEAHARVPGELSRREPGRLVGALDRLLGGGRPGAGLVGAVLFGAVVVFCVGHGASPFGGSLARGPGAGVGQKARLRAGMGAASGGQGRARQGGAGQGWAGQGWAGLGR